MSVKPNEYYPEIAEMSGEDMAAWLTNWVNGHSQNEARKFALAMAEQQPRLTTELFNVFKMFCECLAVKYVLKRYNVENYCACESGHHIHTEVFKKTI